VAVVAVAVIIVAAVVVAVAVVVVTAVAAVVVAVAAVAAVAVVIAAPGAVPVGWCVASSLPPLLLSLLLPPPPPPSVLLLLFASAAAAFVVASDSGVVSVASAVSGSVASSVRLAGVGDTATSESSTVVVEVLGSPAVCSDAVVVVVLGTVSVGDAVVTGAWVCAAPVVASVVSVVGALPVWWVVSAARPPTVELVPLVGGSDVFGSPGRALAGWVLVRGAVPASSPASCWALGALCVAPAAACVGDVVGCGLPPAVGGVVVAALRAAFTVRPAGFVPVVSQSSAASPSPLKGAAVGPPGRGARVASSPSAPAFGCVASPSSLLPPPGAGAVSGCDAPLSTSGDDSTK